MDITKELVLEALSNVNDPDLHKDLVSLGMIDNIKIDNRSLAFEVVLTTPACPLKEIIRKDCENAIHEKLGEDVDIQLTFGSSVTTTRLSGADLLPGVKNIVAVARDRKSVV